MGLLVVKSKEIYGTWNNIISDATEMVNSFNEYSRGIGEIKISTSRAYHDELFTISSIEISIFLCPVQEHEALKHTNALKTRTIRFIMR